MKIINSKTKHANTKHDKQEENNARIKPDNFQANIIQYQLSTTI